MPISFFIAVLLMIGTFDDRAYFSLFEKDYL